MINCFLDTTYLMPLFQLDITIEGFEEEFHEIFQSGRFYFLFSPVSILEIKWQIIKLSKSGHSIDELEKASSRALRTIQKTEQFKLVNFVDEAINSVSFELRKQGHNDLFDTIILGSALSTAAIFVTEDEPLRKVLKKYEQLTVNSEKRARLETHDWRSFVKMFKSME